MRRSVTLLIVAALVFSIVPILSSQAASTVGSFEIEGNKRDDTPGVEPIDWGTPPPNLTNFSDGTGSSDNGFTGGSKELEPGGWTCGTASSPQKDDILSGQIAFRTFGGKQFIYTNYIRKAANGDAHIDYEFNKNPTPVKPGCPAGRTNGDIVITFDTENGGATIIVRAFRWTFTGPGVGTFTEVDTGDKGTTFDGAVNIPANDDPALAGVPAGGFGEAALNLTDTIGTIACGTFASTYMKSRSSTSITSALQDFTNAQPANVGECPNTGVAKNVRNVTTNGSFGLTANASPGDTLEYRIVVTNSGTVPATGVTVTDDIAAKQTFVSCTGGCTTNGPPVTRVTWNLGTLNAGASVTLTFRVVLDSTGFPVGTTTIQNVAVVDTAEEPPKTSPPTTTTVTATVNTALAKAVRNVTTNGTFDTTANASPGDTIEYRLTATNSGNTQATGVVITEPIPTKSTFVSCTGGCTTDGPPVTTVTWNIGTLAPNGGSATVTFRTVLDASFPAGTTTITNVATIDSNEEPVKNSNPATVTVSSVVQTTLVKAVRNVTTNGTFSTSATASPGNTIEYRLTFTNSGNTQATGVVITDPVPAKTTFLSCTGGCTTDGPPVTTVTWNIGTVNAGGQVIVTFQVVLDASFPAGTTTITNVGTVDSNEEPPKNSNPTTVTVTAAPNLALVKSANKTIVAPPDTITYTLAYSNGPPGNAPATGVVITETLPEGTTFASCTGGCTVSGSTVTWNIGTVNPGGGASVTLTVNVVNPPGCTLCNIATIASPDQAGGPRNSNQVCVTLTPGANPAGANASGNATGANVFSSLLSLDLTLPAGNDPAPDHTSVDSTQSGIGSNDEANQVLAVDIPPPAPGSVLHANVLRAETVSTVTALPSQARGTSVGSAANVNILNGTVTATVVRGVADATATGSSAAVSSLGSAIEGLRVLGVPQAVFPGAKVILPAAIFGAGSYVAIYEEIKNVTTPAPGQLSGGTYAGDITVNMIRVHVTNMLVVGQVEVIVGHATAHADFPQTTLCSSQARQAVSGSAFMARVLTDPEILPVIVGAVEIPTSGGLATNSVNTIVVDPLVTSKAATSFTSGGFTSTLSTASSYAEAKFVCVLDTPTGCTIEARLVRAQSNSDATEFGRSSNANGTEFVGLKIGGVPVSLPVAPNTVIALPGIGFVVLNEQIPDGPEAGHTGLTVRAIRVVLLDPAAGGSPGVEVIVAEAHSDAKFIAP